MIYNFSKQLKGFLNGKKKSEKVEASNQSRIFRERKGKAK
jgi:hypothetical protein